MANLCKYYKQVRQVSYDSGVTWVNLGEVQKGDLYEYNSPSCGGVVEYRWVNMDSSTDYYCEGTTKYYKQKKQQSTDGGSTWQDVSPAEYQRGTVAEYQSTDCGYDPPTPPTPTPGDYSTYPFTVVPEDECRFYWLHPEYSNQHLYYSIDSGSTWTEIFPTTSINLNDTILIPRGKKIMLIGNLARRNNIGNAVMGYLGIWATSTTSSTVPSYEIEGNILSLVYGDDFIGKTSMPNPDDKCSIGFSGSDNLVGAGNLVLPLTTLSERCYENFFNGESGLITPPQLPATTLASQCYHGMFADCTSLTTAPELPATTLAGYCYFDMFRGCTSLTTAPELPAETLVSQCYNNMFNGCTSLNYVKCLATDISAFFCTDDWLKGVSSSGTFVKNSSMSGWSRGIDGIPNNWTVQNA